jgi:hypothetical protein
MGALLSTVYFSSMETMFGTLHSSPGLIVDDTSVLAVKVNGGQPKRVTLREFITSRCPSMLEQFRPVWWLARCEQDLYITDGVYLERVAQRTFPDVLLCDRRFLQGRQSCLQ